MLKPAYLVSAADSVVEIYSQVEQDIAADIARRIVKTGYLTDTAKWQLKKAQEFGYLSKNVDKLLAEATGLSTREIRRLMKEAGIKSLAYDDAIYTAAGLTPSAVEKSPALQAMLLQGTDTTLALIGNYTKTTGKVANLAFNNILDRAYIQITSGAFDPNTAIKNAVKEIATSGIEMVAYPSVSYTSLEAAVRRAVTTGVNQSTAKLQLLRAEEIGCELVETSSHAGARPSHQVWQGRVFCLKGKRSGYSDFYSETGYGTGEGLCGWNCYHSFYPYFEGLSTKSFSPDPSADAGSSNLVDYERSQKQRYYERQVRNAKKECVTINAAMEEAPTEALHDELYEQFQRSSVKLKNREAALRKFLQDSVRTRTNEREWTAGFGHSVSSKAVWANRKARKGG